MFGNFFRAIKKFKSQSESSHLSALRAARGEKILELDGTVTTQPVLEHVGISAWPGMFLWIAMVVLLEILIFGAERNDIRLGI